MIARNPFDFSFSLDRGNDRPLCFVMTVFFRSDAKRERGRKKRPYFARRKEKEERESRKSLQQKEERRREGKGCMQYDTKRNIACSMFHDFSVIVSLTFSLQTIHCSGKNSWNSEMSIYQKVICYF